MIKRLKDRIADPKVSSKIKRMALEIMPDRDRTFYAHEIPGTADAGFREWLMHVLGTLRDGAREPALRAMAFDDKQPVKVRAAALAHIDANTNDVEALLNLAQMGEPPVRRAATALLRTIPLSPARQNILSHAAEIRGHTSTNRPPFQDIDAWANFLAAVPGSPDPGRGREVFMSPRLGGCITCHRMEGIGSIAGPNLSTIGAMKNADYYILESILQPSRNVAPQYEAFMLTTADGQTRLVFELAEHDELHTYVGIDGKAFDIQMEKIVKRERLPVSIMPEGLVSNLTDEEFRDLTAFLRSCK
jgi:hypothetical protein